MKRVDFFVFIGVNDICCSSIEGLIMCTSGFITVARGFRSESW